MDGWCEEDSLCPNLGSASFGGHILRLVMSQHCAKTCSNYETPQNAASFSPVVGGVGACIATFGAFNILKYLAHCQSKGEKKEKNSHSDVSIGNTFKYKYWVLGPHM